MTGEERYEELLDEFNDTEGVTLPHGGGGFGRSALRYHGKIFAMFVRGQLVVKLPERRVDELVGAENGVRFDANKGTPMREWFAVGPACPVPWAKLAAEALDFARDSRLRSRDVPARERRVRDPQSRRPGNLPNNWLKSRSEARKSLIMILRGRRSADPGDSGEPRPKRRHVLRWVSAAVVVIISGTLLTAYAKYRAVYDSIHRVTVSDLGRRPPVYSTSSMNILVFGSDSRAGLDHHQQVLLHTGSDEGNNTDTIMLVHISPGRHLITVMSIPRDTMVPSYQCDAGSGYPGQQANPNAYQRINSLLAAGGPSCLWKTVEQQTGIHIDHFIQIGMAGFVNVINDLNGVNVCVPFNVSDPVSGLVLNVGQHHINGVTALAFWRTREDIGMGSDLQRIQRDQFMSAQVVKGILRGGLLTSPTGLLRVLTDAAPSLTTDSGMSQSDLLHIGLSLHGLSGKDVQFVTAPNQPFPADPMATVEFAQPQAGAVFSAIAHDVSIPRGKVTAATSPAGTALAASATPAASAGATAKGATPSAPASSGSRVSGLATSNGGINAAASCGSDAAAFAGPLSP